MLVKGRRRGDESCDYKMVEDMLACCSRRGDVIQASEEKNTNFHLILEIHTLQ
jgi:hypothetical protein